MSKYLWGGRRVFGEDAQEQYSWIIWQIYVLSLKMPHFNSQSCGLSLKSHKECSSFPTSKSNLLFHLFKSQPIYQLKYQSSFNLYVPSGWDVSKKDFSTICTSSFENFLFSSWPCFQLGCLLGILNSLSIPDTNPLSHVYLAKIFPYSGGCLFPQMIASFAVQTLFSFMGS